MSVALQKLGTQGAQLQPLFVTVDAEHDRPDIIAGYMKSFSPRIVGLTGSAAQIEAVKRWFHARMDPDDGKGARRSRNELYLVSPEASFVAAIDGATSGGRMAGQLLNLMSDRQICKPGSERLANGLCPAPVPNAG
jgi:protein SCO1/2